MSDDLRTRIAAVQLQHANVTGDPRNICAQTCQCGFPIHGNSYGELQRVWADHLADAVIRELGLRQEEIGCKTGPVGHEGECT